MKIELRQAGKRYFREWIFRNIDFSISSGDKIAVLGPNGSGKSTFLQLLSGVLSPTEGSIQYTDNNKEIGADEIFKHVSIAAPYLELIEEFTLLEILKFHYSFKKPASALSTGDILELSGLSSSANKIFKYFSSGMKQRVKLSLALLSDVDIILLDEPCSNLDAEAVQWYQNIVNDFASQKVVIVCSNNQEEEFKFCNSHVHVTDWKP